MFGHHHSMASDDSLDTALQALKPKLVSTRNRFAVNDPALNAAGGAMLALDRVHRTSNEDQPPEALRAYPSFPSHYGSGQPQSVERSRLGAPLDVSNEVGTPRPVGGQGPMGGAVGAQGAGDI